MSGIEDSRRIDRRIGWIMSIGGAALLLGQTPMIVAAIGNFPTWWNLGVAALAAVVLVLAASGWALPYTVLAMCWRLIPILGAFLMFTSFASYQAPIPHETVPWILAFDAVICAYLLLWLPPWAAAAGTIVSAMLVPLSALLFLDDLPHTVLATMPIHMSNIVYIAIFVGIRRRMIAMRAAERAAEESRARRARASLDAEHREHVSRMLHDEVLSVLTAAFRVRGAPSPQLRAEARRALGLLETPPQGSTPGSESCMTALDRLLRAVRSVDPQCLIDASHDEGSLPKGVIDAMIGAASEALRNSLRYAGSDTRRTLSARVEEAVVEVAVRDDGDGFDPGSRRPDSLGIDQSIVGRMRGLPGGGAAVFSRPGGPTAVELTWRT